MIIITIIMLVVYVFVHSHFCIAPQQNFDKMAAADQLQKTCQALAQCMQHSADPDRLREENAQLRMQLQAMHEALQTVLFGQQQETEELRRTRQELVEAQQELQALRRATDQASQRGQRQGQMRRADRLALRSD